MGVGSILGDFPGALWEVSENPGLAPGLSSALPGAPVPRVWTVQPWPRLLEEPSEFKGGVF